MKPRLPGLPRFLFFAAAVLLVACFLAQALRHVHDQNATYDERSYFGLGKVILETGRWEGRTLLHPPLSFYVAALPMLWQDGLPDADDARTLWRARVTSLLVFGLPLLCGVTLWAYELHGPRAALMALALAAFCPTLLAHAPLLTPDAALTSTGFLTVYLYWRSGGWGAQPSDGVSPRGPSAGTHSRREPPDAGRSRPWMWGLTLGLALLAKMTALLFVGVIAALAAVRALRGRRAAVLWTFAAGLGVAWLVLCAGYGFSGLLDWNAKAELLARRPPLPPLRLLARTVAPLLPLPYFNTVGRQANVAISQWPCYLLGEVSLTGWRYYFLVALAVKETVAFLLLVAAAIVSLRWMRPRREELILLMPAALFLLVFNLSKVQIGIRYILPALPFLFVFASRLAALAARAHRVVPVTLVVLLGWHAASTTAAGPDFLSYFNEVAGGPDNGYRYLGDSNLDWGQNHTRAARWAHGHGAHFDPLVLPEQGWVVISTNRVQGILLGRPLYRLLRDEYDPVERIGHNYFVYDLARNRRFPQEAVVPVLSGPRWRSGPAAGPWMEEGFAESGWSPAAGLARVTWFVPAQVYPGTQAQVMTCGGGATECAFRHEFVLNAPAAQAILYLATRGAYELYANGRAVAVRAGCNDGAWRKEERRLERVLRPGRNLIALRAPRCGGDAGPYVFAEMRVAQRWPPP